MVGASVVIAACGDVPAASRDAALIEQFEHDRTGFTSAVTVMTAEPRIQRLDLRSNGTAATDPADAAPDRTAKLTEFMRAHDIRSIGSSPDGSVSFQMFTSGIVTSGQLKALDFLTTEPDGPVVADTDAEIAKSSDKWRVVYRRVDDGWYIRNSCC